MSRDWPVELADDAVADLEFNMETNWMQEGKFLDNYASALIIMFAMAIALLASVTSITTERVSGTMERIFVSPYRRSEIIIGKNAGKQYSRRHCRHSYNCHTQAGFRHHAR